jgi:hypothetical protein
MPLPSKLNPPKTGTAKNSYFTRKGKIDCAFAAIRQSDTTLNLVNPAVLKSSFERAKKGHVKVARLIG